MPDTVTVPALNDAQATKILTDALAANMYEGSLPDTEAGRIDDASRLVAAAKQAFASGNNGEQVMAILFTAEVDMAPLATPAEAASDDDAADFAQIPDALLDKLISKLDTYVSTPTVEAERSKLMAEKTRRAQSNGGASAQAAQPEEVPASAPPATPAPAAPDTPDPVGGSLGPQDQGDVPGSPAAPASADADAQPVSEASAPSAEAGDVPQAQPSAEDAERTALMGKLTVAMMQAHGVGMEQIAALSTESLQYFIDNPDGPPVPPQPAEPTHVASVTAPEPAAAPEVAHAPETEATASDLAPEREKLEERVTGPMLKAFGRGRRDVPDIGDQELTLMVEHPDGKVTKEELEAAKARDRGTELPSAPSAGGEEGGAAAVTESAPPAAATSPEPPVASPEPPTASGEEPTGADAVAEALAAREQQTGEVAISSGTQRALEIIAKEHLPIPPEIDGEPPILPSDMSTLGQAEIYSLHARFHACESRVAWLLLDAEEERDDVIRLRRMREIEVADNLPATEDRKKLTDSQREVKVANDDKVREYVAQEAEISKVVRRLKVLRDNYHMDCRTASRQMSRWTEERDDTPGS